MKVKECILEIIKENDWYSLPGVIKNYNKKKSKEETPLEEALKELSHSQQTNLWEGIVNVFVEKYLGKYVGQSSETTNKETEEDLHVVESFLALGFISICCLINDEKETSAPCEKLTQFVVLTGGLISEFSDPVDELAVNLCEKWIINKFQRSEEIVADTLLAVLDICLQPKAKKNDVKRAWNLRDGMSTLCNRTTDENDKARTTVKKLLLSCISSSLILNCEEGIKLLSLILISPSLVTEFHEVVKSSMPFITKSQSEKYSQIYFRGWKSSSGKLRKTIEENCLQDFMYLAIHADPFASRLSSNLNTFLHHIHKHKKHLQTASVIYSLYEPFLWRSLKVANGYVRMNATTLLCDLFPCNDIALTLEEKEELMDQQYQALLTVLVDPCHLVRISAIKGIFSILSDFWLLIPSHIIQKIFHILLKKLIVDASTAEIRMLVVQGMTHLLDCPDAGPYMSNVLPHIAPAFDDINASVRIAFVKMLLKVKATRFIKYWKLIPMEHLLNRLAEDKSNVRALISQLIYSSFLSPHLEETEMVQRCINLVEMNREGARRFYQHSSKKLDIESTTRFMLFIWKTLQRYSQVANTLQSSCNSSNSACDENEIGHHSLSSSTKRKTRKQRKINTENKENKDENEECNEMPLDNPNVVGGLLDTIAILWTMNSVQLSQPQNLKYLDALRSKISRSFPIIWSFFKENEEISNTLLYLSSFLPKSHVPTMTGLCLSRLKSLEENEKVNNNYATYVNALCNWNRHDDVMELISEWIDGTFSSVERCENSFTNKRGKKVCFKEKREPKPILALCIMNHILHHPLNKVSLLETNRNLLVSLSQKMSTVQKYLKERFKNVEGELSSLCSDYFLLNCWSDYLCIVALLNRVPSNGGEFESKRIEDPEKVETRISANARKSSECPENDFFDSLSTFKHHMLWINRILEENLESEIDLEFYYKCGARFLKGSSDLVAVGVADQTFLYQYLNLIQKLLHEAPFELNMWCWSLHGIIHAHQFLRVYISKKENLIPDSSACCRVFAASILCLKDKECIRNLEMEEVERLSEAVESTLVHLCEESDLTLRFFSNLIVQSILEDVFRQVSESREEKDFSRLNDLSGSALILLKSVHKKSKLAHSFISTLKDAIGEDSPEYNKVTSAVFLLSVLSNDCGKMSRHSLNEAIKTVDEILRSFP